MGKLFESYKRGGNEQDPVLSYLAILAYGVVRSGKEWYGGVRRGTEGYGGVRSGLGTGRSEERR